VHAIHTAALHRQGVNNCQLWAAAPALQQAWPEHKAVHKSAASAGEAWLFCTKRGKGRSDTMPGFAWTGPLRPACIGPTRQVRRCR
jgi:methionyl aminopeptidase